MKQEQPSRDVPRFTVTPAPGGSVTIPGPQDAPAETTEPTQIDAAPRRDGKKTVKTGDERDA